MDVRTLHNGKKRKKFRAVQIFLLLGGELKMSTLELIALITLILKLIELFGNNNKKK